MATQSEVTDGIHVLKVLLATTDFLAQLQEAQKIRGMREGTVLVQSRHSAQRRCSLRPRLRNKRK